MTIRILQGDCREVLKTLPAESVHCCVTSPPYYGLRDYGTAEWTGGNNPHCEHGRTVWEGEIQPRGVAQSGHAAKSDRHGRRECIHCGATRIDSQIGLEETPESYVAELVSVFREVRRVLRKDGTLWLNLGDSYWASGQRQTGRNDTDRETPGGRGGSFRGGVRRQISTAISETSIKPKDLIGIPWMVAFALRADGWWLRSDIIWHKPNPMPESVTDRPTNSHEHIFLLTKSERYFFDADAVREPLQTDPKENYEARAKILGRGMQGAASARGGDRDKSGGFPPVDGGRNIRNVWTVTPKPYSESHFATYPPALIEPCIKAGSPIGGLVLDPFGGAGTTGMVADRLRRDAALIELNPAYAEMMRDRLQKDGGMFTEIAAE